MGCYPHEEIHLELIDGAQPVFKKAYPVPFKREEVFKHELDNLVADGVLEKVYTPSAWALPTFIIPKKDETVRWVSDFCELNKLLKRKPYPLPRIQDIMNKQGNYTYMTKIDLSMMFYLFKLDNQSKELCTINTPYGLYRYKRLPMGVKISPDVAQAIIMKVFHDVKVVCYIDDLGIWTNGTYEEHLQLIDTVLARLSENGLKCNPLKCAWCVQETDFLGYWMTPNGIKPMRSKIDAVLRMGRPINQTQVRSFIGAVNYYRLL